MGEKIYGGNKPSYGVTDSADGWIDLHVYHINSEVRSLLHKHTSDPSHFLRHHAAYKRSKIRAKYWLAEVIDHYRSHFAQNRVRITLK